MPRDVATRPRHFPTLLSRAGEHAHAVEVWEDGRTRWMQFGNGPVQSRMDIARPHTLALAYTRVMASALLFVEAPAHALLLGLGGGSIARFLGHHFRALTMTAIEHEPAVVRAARAHFALPGARLEVRVADACAPDTDLGRRADLAFLDLFDHDGLPAPATRPEVLARFRAAVEEGGVLACNLWVDDDDEHLRVTEGVRAAFGPRTLVAPVDGYRNLVVLAFPRAPAPLLVDALAARAAHLGPRLGLDLAATVALLARCNRVEGGAFAF